MTDSNFHFFATFALGWATGPSRQAAINKLVDSHRAEFKRMAVATIADNGRGAYIWSVQVNEQADKDYKINFYQPVDVDMQDARESYVTRVTAKTVNFWTDDKGGK